MIQVRPQVQVLHRGSIPLSLCRTFAWSSSSSTESWEWTQKNLETRRLRVSSAFTSSSRKSQCDLSRFNRINRKACYRYLSTTTTVAKPKSSQPESKSPPRGDFLKLYERSTERNKIPRAALGVSLFNTIYWTWYSFDFIPAVNASAMESIHVDPTVGYVGLALGVLINTATVLYPLSSVSKITLSPTQQIFRVYGYNLPLITPSTSYREYSLGDLTMNPSSTEAKKILHELDGDLKQFSGLFGLRAKSQKRLPLLVEVRQPEEVLRPKLFLESILNPQDIASKRTKRPRPQTTPSGSKSSSIGKKKSIKAKRANHR